MTNDNYNLPNERDFFNTILQYFESRNDQEIVKLLTGGKCSFTEPSSLPGFSRDDNKLKITFMIPVKNMEYLLSYNESKIRKICLKILQLRVEFSYIELDFVPIIEESNEESLTRQIDETVKSLSKLGSIDILPEEIILKGKEMAEVYLYLYCVENSLRLFIKQIAEKNYGRNFFDSLKISRDIKSNINNRKKQESKSKWLPIRGDSELFYLDFKDLGAIIQNNWDLFKEYFPDQHWIMVKINEIAECRNFVAHNSYIGPNEKDIIRTNYYTILRQLNLNNKN